ncbi:MAG: hypothetical protein K0S39_2876 [Paenibacillus sp.]|jgi:hypothetical protein|nr:hypothetical protein [Paenibacillus sp.]
MQHMKKSHPFLLFRSRMAFLLFLSPDWKNTAVSASLEETDDEGEQA